jgi:hypothetical protein
LLAEIAAAAAEVSPTLKKLQAFSWDEARLAVRNNSAACERIRVIESAVSQASMLTSSSTRDLAEIPARIEGLTVRDLRLRIFFTRDAEKAGIEPHSAAEPGSIKILVGNYASVPRRLRELCAIAEGRSPILAG